MVKSYWKKLASFTCTNDSILRSFLHFGPCFNWDEDIWFKFYFWTLFPLHVFNAIYIPFIVLVFSKRIPVLIKLQVWFMVYQNPFLCNIHLKPYFWSSMGPKIIRFISLDSQLRKEQHVQKLPTYVISISTLHQVKGQNLPSKSSQLMNLLYIDTIVLQNII